MYWIWFQHTIIIHWSPLTAKTCLFLDNKSYDISNHFLSSREYLYIWNPCNFVLIVYKVSNFYICFCWDKVRSRDPLSFVVKYGFTDIIRAPTTRDLSWFTWEGDLKGTWEGPVGGHHEEDSSYVIIIYKQNSTFDLIFKFTTKINIYLH